MLDAKIGSATGSRSARLSYLHVKGYLAANLTLAS